MGRPTKYTEELDLEIIEKRHNSGSAYPIAVLVINNHHKNGPGTISWSKKALNELAIKRDTGVLYSINKKDGRLFLAFEGGVSTSGRKTFNICTRGSAIPAGLRYKVQDGIYKINLIPIYHSGYDWYGCEKIEDPR